ncbi:MAG TPA: PAS domain S-box protein, partial [Ilumatobacteraceae bacterium]|nr:PAS domain S-box protein [Ilumatobacteraceae bacterium]
ASASAIATEAGFGLIAESIPHIVWTATPDGTTTYFNRRATTYAGSRTEAAHSWDWLSLVHRDDAERADAAWTRSLCTHTACSIDIRIRRFDGRFRWHAFRCVPIRDEHNSLVKWIGTATDIDDAKVVEGDLRHTERQTTETLQLLELLQSKAPVGFGFLDREFRVLHMNETLAAANGMTVAEQLGRTVEELAPDVWPQLEASYRQVLEAGLPALDVEIDGPMTADPADRRRYTASHYPIEIDDEIIGIGIVAVDITIRQRADEVLRFQSALLAAAGQAIVAVNTQRDVIYWNRAAEELYGWTAAEAIGRPTLELIRRVEEPGHPERMRQRMQEGKGWAGDYEVTLADGRRITVYVTNTPVFDDDGKWIAVIGSSIDITERKAVEAIGRRLGAIVDGSGDAIFGTTNDGIVTSWNRAAEDLFGYTSEEMIGHPIGVIATAGERESEQSGMRERLGAGGAAEHLETVRTRKDGSTVDVLITASSSHDESGAMVGLSVIAQDITVRLTAQRALEASRRRLAEAQRTAQIGSFEFDVLSGELAWSEEYCRIMGVALDTTPTPESFVSMVHPADVDSVVTAWSCAVGQGEPIDIELRIVRSDSEVRTVHARAMPEAADDGSVLRVAGTMIDITDQVEADRVTRAAELRFEIGFEQSAIGAAITDLNGLPVRVNPAACLFFERPPDQLIGRRWTDYTHPDEMPLGQSVLGRLAGGHDTYADERRYLRPDGSIVWALTHVTLVRDEKGEPEYFFVQLQDITGRKVMEQELAHQALHDSLTGLPNRALLTDRLIHGLARTRRNGSQLAVMFLDIDQFKMVNDSLGHSAGDDLLRHAAAQIEEALRPGDTVARFGGDEFVVVCDDVSVLEIAQVAERVLETLSRPWHIGDEEMHITASLGIAVADDTATPESLLRDSDAAMYRAKERGRGRFEMFDEALRFKASRRLATASALHRALERDEFVVQYQPVVSLVTGEMVSVEALVRWNHPEHGLVTPDAFISLAEETGLIVPIGARVLDQACQDLAMWQRISSASDIDSTLSIAVNLSVRQMLAPDIAGSIADVLQRTGIDPGNLCLELTESVFMEDVDYFGRTLSSLKTLGVDLSIDDFGTGYSSLSYLKLFPVDAVKVDRVFVDGLGTDPHDTALVAAIVAMASALDLQVTAEGVETHQQLAGLKRLGVPRAQGFYLARPMSANMLSRLIAVRHRWDVS